MPYTVAQLEAFVSSAHYDAHTAAAIASGIPALPRLKGEQISPGVTRIHGNLCNVHGKYGPCDAALSGKKKPKKGRGRKPAKPKQSDAQRTQERTAKQEQNQKKVFSQLGLAEDATAALTSLRAGQPVTDDGDLVKMGLAEQAQDGSYRLTPTGRALMAAASAGDAGRARDTVSRGTDAQGKRVERTAAQAKRQQDSAGRRAANQIGRELTRRQRADAAAKKRAAAAAKKPAKASDKKPDKTPIEKPRKPVKRIARSQAPHAPALSNSPTKPKPAAPKPEKAPAKQIAPALTEAATALSQGDDVSDEQVMSLVRNGLVKLNKDGEPVLTAAGLRATMKAQSDQDKAMFASMGGGGGGGGSGGGGKGSGGGKNTLWPKGPSGKRTPQAAAAESRSGGGGGSAKPSGGGAAKPKDPHAPSKSDRAVADRVRNLSERDAAITDKMTALRREHDALSPSWGQTLQPKYRKEREAKQADLMGQIHTLRNERDQIQQQSHALLSHPEGRAAMDRVVRQEIITRQRGGKSMPGDDVTLRMIEEQHGIRAPQAPSPHAAPQAITHNPDRARAANTEYQARQHEARGLRRQAIQAEADADRMEATSPHLARELRLSAADNKWRAFGLETGPRATDLLREIEASGYRLNGTGRGLAKVTKLSTTPKIKDYSFRIFKDATGRDRWVAQSSTAFQDRDREIVSTKALADDVAFADATGSYGPLRWWHTPGLDLGDCDFNAMHGRVLIESGTFRSPAIAQKVAAAAPGLEISLGFVHLPSEPDADGVFHHIRRFERSLVPRGKASNRFTAFTVKETRMFDPTKVAALKTLGFSDDDITGLQAQAEATEKSAADQGVAFKADEPAELPDVIINGVTYKAFPAAAEAAPSAEEDAMDGGADDAMEEPVDENALTLSQGDLAAIQGMIAQVMGALELEKKVAGHVQGLMAPYQATKDASDAEKAEQIAALQTAIKDTQAKLAELTGDQPAAPYRASQAKDNVLTDATMLAAAKQLADPNANDPWADIKMGLGLSRPQ